MLEPEGPRSGVRGPKAGAVFAPAEGLGLGLLLAFDFFT